MGKKTHGTGTYALLHSYVTMEETCQIENCLVTFENEHKLSFKRIFFSEMLSLLLSSLPEEIEILIAFFVLNVDLITGREN